MRYVRNNTERNEVHRKTKVPIFFVSTEQLVNKSFMYSQSKPLGKFRNVALSKISRENVGRFSVNCQGFY